MIKIDHSACLALGGTFEPCYFLNIQTVPSQMGPSTNKRNAALIQNFMSDILSVPAERGIVTFTPIPEENLAMAGKTMLGEIERLNKQSNGDLKSPADSGSRKPFNRKSIGDVKNNSYLSGRTVGESGANSQVTTPTPSQMNGSVTRTDDDDRPSTAHGSAVNGLRMNGISTENLVGKNTRTPDGRPKTFGGTSATSIQDQIKNEPMPHVSRQSTSGSLATLKSQGRSSKGVDIKKIGAPKDMQKNSLNGPGASHAGPRLSLTPAVSNNNVPTTNGRTSSNSNIPTTSSRTGSSTAVPSTTNTSNNRTTSSTTLPSHATRGSEHRAKNTYLDGVSTLTNKVPPAPKHQEEDDDDGSSQANMGKRRRSTMTATPKLPLQAPPVPDDSKETKSTRSLRLGKRKSFLRGFMRRSTQV